MTAILVLAVAGALVGAVRAVVRRGGRDAVAAAVITGTLVGGGVGALPLVVDAGLEGLPDWAAPLVTLGVVVLVAGGLISMVVNDLFGRRSR